MAAGFILPRVSGSWTTAGLIFADMGFEVIKVEKPCSGDISRELNGTSAGTFMYYNRGKKSLELDIKTDFGKEVLTKLLSTADIIVIQYLHNHFLPGVHVHRIILFGKGISIGYMGSSRLYFQQVFGLGRTVKEDIDMINETGANISLHLPFKLDNMGQVYENISYCLY